MNIIRACNKCQECKKENCNTCKNCLDKKKRHKKCIMRKCTAQILQQKFKHTKMMIKKKIFRPCGNCMACKRENCQVCKFCQHPNKKKRCIQRKRQNQIDRKKLENPMTKIKRKSNERLANVKLHQKVKFLHVELVTTALNRIAIYAHHVKTKN